MPHAHTDWQAEYVLLHMEHHQLKGRLEQALKALQAVEWVTNYATYKLYCPWCKGGYPDHRADCARQAALTEATKEV